MLQKYRVPGIYIERQPDRIEPIQIVSSSIAGFIGLADKGPIQNGIRITNFKQFTNIFGGFTDYSYLAYSVYGFFNSGGSEYNATRNLAAASSIRSIALSGRCRSVTYRDESRAASINAASEKRTL